MFSVPAITCRMNLLSVYELQKIGIWILKIPRNSFVPLSEVHAIRLQDVEMHDMPLEDTVMDSECP